MEYVQQKQGRNPLCSKSYKCDVCKRGDANSKPCPCFVAYVLNNQSQLGKNNVKEWLRIYRTHYKLDSVVKELEKLSYTIETVYARDQWIKNKVSLVPPLKDGFGAHLKAIVRNKKREREVEQIDEPTLLTNSDEQDAIIRLIEKKLVSLANEEKTSYYCPVVDDFGTPTFPSFLQEKVSAVWSRFQQWYVDNANKSQLSTDMTIRVIDLLEQTIQALVARWNAKHPSVPCTLPNGYKAIKLEW